MQSNGYFKLQKKTGVDKVRAVISRISWPEEQMGKREKSNSDKWEFIKKKKKETPETY